MTRGELRSAQPSPNPIFLSGACRITFEQLDDQLSLGASRELALAGLASVPPPDSKAENADRPRYATRNVAMLSDSSVACSSMREAACAACSTSAAFCRVKRSSSVKLSFTT